MKRTLVRNKLPTVQVGLQGLNGLVELQNFLLKVKLEALHQALHVARMLVLDHALLALQHI